MMSQSSENNTVSDKNDENNETNASGVNSSKFVNDSATSSINSEELEKFAKMADEWWDPTGKFKPLHKFNPCRINYIKEIVTKSHKKLLNIDNNPDLSFDADKPFAGLKILDIGCGGGLLAEPMAKLGADVTAIDALEKNIKIAKIHAEQSQLEINYLAMTVEELLAETANEDKYDVILTMEIVEHVNNPAEFIDNCSKLLADNGHLFIATLNRTIKSYVLAIIGAEYVMRWLPVGTHQWHKFLYPQEIEKFISNTAVKLQSVKGATYNILKDKWAISNDTSVNYVMHFINN
ncbi:MAG: bifunctional 2-polyprenyl-6-hydroxyphenol methylase/3-demethylubiquinol 3-O-methyltransferase UbiG [Pseudomonadota bacterium]